MSTNATALQDLVDDCLGRIRRWKKVASKPRKSGIRADWLRYAWALADGRPTHSENVFIVVTEAGESLVLTAGMMRALEDQPAVLSDEVVCVLDPVDPSRAPDEPVRELHMILAVGARRLQPGDHATVRVCLRPADLHAPYVLFTSHRPPPWPR